MLTHCYFKVVSACAQASLKAGNSGRTELKSAETSVIGALAGAVTGFATTPLDVIKTRLMTQGERGQYKGIVDCARQIYREEGTSAFLRVGRHSTLSSRPSNVLEGTSLTVVSRHISQMATLLGLLVMQPLHLPECMSRCQKLCAIAHNFLM